MVSRIIIIISCLLLAVGCKQPPIDCTYNLTVTWQERKAVKDPIPLTTSRVYAFFVDPQQWEVTSIEDARNGSISRIGNPTDRQSYDQIGIASGEYGNQFSFVFDREPVMLVVADEKYPMWATGNANVVPDLPNMFVTLNFTPLDKAAANSEPYVKGPWKFYGYKNVLIPIDTDIEILPVVTYRGQHSSQILYGAGCYAFYGLEKAKAEVASWSDASQGIARKLLDNDRYEQVDFDVAGTPVQDSLFMNVSDEKVMVVVYNQPSLNDGVRMFAYGFFDLADNPVTKSNTVLFDLNKTSDSWTSDIWTVNVEYPAEDSPQDPEDGSEDDTPQNPEDDSPQESAQYRYR